MAAKNEWFTRLTRPYLPDKQSVTVFFTAVITSAALTAFNHVHVISDATASIKPAESSVVMTQERNRSITPTTTPTRKMNFDFPDELLETSTSTNAAIEKPLAVAVTDKATVKAKPVANKTQITPVKLKALRNRTKVKSLRMKIVGTQDGIAWYVDKFGEVLQVKVGDTVPGIGTLGIIRDDRTIITADGNQVVADSVY